MAGYSDAGHGTYRVPDRDGCHDRLDMLVDSYQEGFIDGLLDGTEWY
jgi:hypothetical protein